MLVAGGVHPYALRRRQIVLSRSKPLTGGVVSTLLLAVLLVVGFAYGLRSIDRRLVPNDRPEPSKVRSSDIPTYDLTA